MHTMGIRCTDKTEAIHYRQETEFWTQQSLLNGTVTQETTTHEAPCTRKLSPEQAEAGHRPGVLLPTTQERKIWIGHCDLKLCSAKTEMLRKKCKSERNREPPSHKTWRSFLGKKRCLAYESIEKQGQKGYSTSTTCCYSSAPRILWNCYQWQDNICYCLSLLLSDICTHFSVTG